MMFLASFLFALVALSKGESDQRIVGGSTATYGDHPYICSLQILSGTYEYHVCGCVIWNNDYVVTAAHCLKRSASEYRVVVGNQYILSTETYQENHTVFSYTKHQNYSDNIHQGIPNDIAVIKMEIPITFNSHVKKAIFARSGSFVGDSCVLAGWGKRGNGYYPNALQSVNLTKISNSECAQRWPGHIISSGHICFFEGTGLAACSGDSGGPVHCGGYMTGITSWIELKCTGKYPSVYTRVSEYYDWLVSQAGSN